MQTQQTLFDKTPLVYGTDHFTEEQKVKSRKSAESQEARILAYLSRYPYNKRVSASDLWNMLAKGCEQVGSFRRALTNLKKQGKVEKLDKTVLGMFGANEHLWRLKRDDA